MKLFKALLILLVTVPILGYVLLFTSLGNVLLTPYVEKKINSHFNTHIKIDNFSLTYNTFELKGNITPNNIIEIVGNYAYFSSLFNAAYRLRINEAEELNALLEYPLQGKISTDGTIKGSFDTFNIVGISDIADSNTHYTLTIEHYKLSNINLETSNMKSSKLLTLLSQKNYINGLIDASLMLDLHNHNAPLGNINIISSESSLDTYLLQRDFNITLSSSHFNTRTSVHLSNDKSHITSALHSDIIDIKLDAYKEANNSIEAHSNISIHNLAILTPFVNHKLQGKANFTLTLTGNKATSLLNIHSNIANSDTYFKSNLVDFKPTTFSLDTTNLDIKKLNYMLDNNTSYIRRGIVDSTIYINDVNTLTGNMSTTLKNANLIIDKDNTLKLDMNSSTLFNNNTTISSLDVKSDNFNLRTSKSVYNILSREYTSDFTLEDFNLSLLKYYTGIEIDSKISVKGIITKKDELKVKAYSEFCDGEVMLQLNNRDLRVESKDINTLKLLSVLHFPKLLNGTLDSVLNYSLRYKTGALVSQLKNAKLTHNRLLNYAYTFSNKQIYNEIYKGNIQSEIEDSILISSMNLESNQSRVTMQESYFNIFTQHTNTELNITVNDIPVIIKIKGLLRKPAINIENHTVIKNEIL